MHPSTTRSEELKSTQPDIHWRTALWPAATTAALGFAILYLVGFAAPTAIHDAAHDTRHSLNFPCH